LCEVNVTIEIPRLVIAAPASGSGKSTVAAGLMARSAGALALGYRDFDPALKVAGVICNRVDSAKHTQWVTEAVESVGLPVLGCIPKLEGERVAQTPRHSGGSRGSSTCGTSGICQRQLLHVGS
jgi:cobyrinic acid a,c-diamide synthase